MKTGVRRRWLFAAILIVSVLVYFSPAIVSLSCGNTVIVLGKSMEPTIMDGDRVTVDREAYMDADPERGDIVLLKHDETQLIQNGKRIIGLPGETITFEGGAVYVDGVKLDEPYLAPGTRTESEIKEFRIPSGSYFVLGDNRQGSADSRLWGTIPVSAIRGKILL